MNVKLIKLFHGEEIIAECEETRKGLRIKDAAQLFSGGRGKIVLATWMSYTTVQHGFILPEKAYLFHADVEKEMLDYYNKWRTESSETNQTNVT